MRACVLHHVLRTRGSAWGYETGDTAPLAVRAVQRVSGVSVGSVRCQQRRGALLVWAEQARCRDGGLGSKVRHLLELPPAQQASPVLGLHRPVRACGVWAPAGALTPRVTPMNTGCVAELFAEPEDDPPGSLLYPACRLLHVPMAVRL